MGGYTAVVQRANRHVRDLVRWLHTTAAGRVAKPVRASAGTNREPGRQLRSHVLRRGDAVAESRQLGTSRRTEPAERPVLLCRYGPALPHSAAEQCAGRGLSAAPVQLLFESPDLRRVLEVVQHEEKLY